jgi:hypothetical protein
VGRSRQRRSGGWDLRESTGAQHQGLISGSVLPCWQSHRIGPLDRKSLTEVSVAPFRPCGRMLIRCFRVHFARLMKMIVRVPIGYKSNMKMGELVFLVKTGCRTIPSRCGENVARITSTRRSLIVRRSFRHAKRCHFSSTNVMNSVSLCQ